MKLTASSHSCPNYPIFSHLLRLLLYATSYQASNKNQQPLINGQVPSAPTTAAPIPLLCVHPRAILAALVCLVRIWQMACSVFCSPTERGSDSKKQVEIGFHAHENYVESIPGFIRARNDIQAPCVRRDQCPGG